MDSIPLLHSNVARPILDRITEEGVDLQSLVTRYNLPQSILNDGDSFVSEYKIYCILDDVARRHKIPDIGFKVCPAFSQESLGSISLEMKQIQSIEKALDLFCRRVSEVSSEAMYFVHKVGRRVYFCRTGSSSLRVGEEFAEQYCLQMMLGIIRMLSDKDWTPKSVYLQTSSGKAVSQRAEFESCKFHLNKEFTAIQISSNGGLDISNSNDNISIETLDTTYLESLRKLLAPYWGEKYITIELAAELANTSVRSLERKLESLGETYKHFTNTLRMDIACNLLEDSDHSIKEIAAKLSYSSASNFSRAFREYSGNTPIEFRSNEQRKKCV